VPRSRLRRRWPRRRSNLLAYYTKKANKNNKRRADNAGQEKGKESHKEEEVT
jgi:hypothetical protein